VVREHFGGSAWPLSNLGFDSDASIYVGIVALAANLLVTALLTPLFRLCRVRDGEDVTRELDYIADEGDPTIRRMTEILDGEPPRDAPVPVGSSFVPLGSRRSAAPPPPPPVHPRL
jgi:SSS family solute:Na+ symporter